MYFRHAATTYFDDFDGLGFRLLPRLQRAGAAVSPLFCRASLPRLSSAATFFSTLVNRAEAAENTAERDERQWSRSAADFTRFIFAVAHHYQGFTPGGTYRHEAIASLPPITSALPLPALNAETTRMMPHILAHRRLWR